MTFDQIEKQIRNNLGNLSEDGWRELLKVVLAFPTDRVSRMAAENVLIIMDDYRVKNGLPELEKPVVYFLYSCNGIDGITDAYRRELKSTYPKLNYLKEITALKKHLQENPEYGRIDYKPLVDKWFEERNTEVVAECQ